MRILQSLAAGCAALLLAGPACGDAKDEAAKLLVGKWEIKQEVGKKEAAAVLDFGKDGKFTLKVSGAADITADGSYKVLDEKTLEITLAFLDLKRTEKATFKVTKDTLE